MQQECNTLNYSENLWDLWSTKQAVDMERDEADDVTWNFQIHQSISSLRWIAVQTITTSRTTVASLGLMYITDGLKTGAELPKY